MPRSSGTYTLPAGNPVVTGTTISSTTYNNTQSDIASALTQSVSKDGQTTMTGNLPMGGFKLTGLGNGSAASDSVTVGQIASNIGSYVGTVGGTGDAITLTPSPAITAYAAGQRFSFISSAANTTNVTVNISGLGAKAVTKYGTTALVANDISGSGRLLTIAYDGTQFQIVNFVETGTSGHTIPLLDGANTFSTVNTFSVPQQFSTGIQGAGYSNNIGLAASVASNALTIALKGKDGNDPSATNPVQIAFRNATATTGDYTILTVTAATSLVISSGSTMGTTSAQAARIWIVAFNDAGTFRLGAINCSTSTNIYPLADDILASSTAEGGAGAADSAGVFYTGTAVTSKAMRVLGYIEATEATAGTWATTPSKVQLWTPGMKLPGDIIQRTITSSGAVATGTTIIPYDDTIPQNTEGDQYFTLSITPTSSINTLIIKGNVNIALSAGSKQTVALFQDSTANALATSETPSTSFGYMYPCPIFYSMLAGTTSSTSIKLRAGVDSAATTTINGSGGTRLFGGSLFSYLEVTELMG